VSVASNRGKNHRWTDEEREQTAAWVQKVDQALPSVDPCQDVELMMERLRKDKRTPLWVREFIALLAASVVVLGERLEELESRDRR
jgi:hypothetical protein